MTSRTAYENTSGRYPSSQLTEDDQEIYGDFNDFVGTGEKLVAVKAVDQYGSVSHMKRMQVPGEVYRNMNWMQRYELRPDIRENPVNYLIEGLWRNQGTVDKENQKLAAIRFHGRGAPKEKKAKAPKGKKTLAVQTSPVKQSDSVRQSKKSGTKPKTETKPRTVKKHPASAKPDNTPEEQESPENPGVFRGFFGSGKTNSKKTTAQASVKEIVAPTASPTKPATRKSSRASVSQSSRKTVKQSSRAATIPEEEQAGSEEDEDVEAGSEADESQGE